MTDLQKCIWKGEFKCWYHDSLWNVYRSLCLCYILWPEYKNTLRSFQNLQVFKIIVCMLFSSFSSFSLEFIFCIFTCLCCNQANYHSQLFIFSLFFFLFHVLFRCWNQTHFICYNLTLLLLYRPRQQSALTARLAASCRWSYGLVDWQRRGRWRSISAKTITSFRYYYLIYVPCCVLCALCSGCGTWTWNLTYSLICSIFLYNKILL